MELDIKGFLISLSLTKFQMQTLEKIIFKDWISAKEKMPTHNKGVLVFIPDEDFHITSGMWDISNKWVLLDEYRIPDCEVTHWMNMPEIPQEYIKDGNESNEILKTLSVLLKEGKISLNSNEPGAVSSHEEEKEV